MIGDKMADALNTQVNKEMYSGYLYLAMSAQATHLGYNGVANWFKVQTQEEMTHAMKMYDYLNSQEAKVTLLAIDKPSGEYTSIQEMFEKTLEHEKLVTSLIHNLVKISRDEHDYASEIFLQWFVTEQIEEEENATEILNNLRMMGDKGEGVFMIDKDLGSRVFTPPAPSGE